MEDYNKIIESLGIRFINCRSLNSLKPMYVTNYKDVSNVMLVSHQENMFSLDLDKPYFNKGDILFLPAGKTTPMVFGDKIKSEKINNDKFINNLDNFFKFNYEIDPVRENKTDISIINFEAKIFDAVNYFSSLDIPPFVIKASSKFSYLMLELLDESFGNRVGKERIIQNLMESLVIEVLRYIVDHQMFLEQLATNTTYFKDPRLIDIFKYIKENLSGDLSNKVLANVANVSEDYVGQYFKMLTSINPQDYIEYQRMEHAVYLLRTTRKSIRDIGTDVGYKDTAYFCRRFKMMFGIPAGKMRKRESLINI